MSSLLIGVIALALSSCVPKSLTDAFQIDKRTSAMLVPSARFHPLHWQLSVDSWRPTAKIRKHHASSPRPFFCDQRSGKGGDDDAASGDGRRWLLPHVVVAPWARALLIFGLGYGLGGASAPGWQRQSRVASRVGATRIALIVLVLRDVWRSTPQWAKPRIAKYGRNVINFLSVPFRKKSVRYLDETDVEDGDDITDISNIATKIQSAMKMALIKLVGEKDDQIMASAKTAQARDDFNIQASVLALLQLQSQIKSKGGSVRDQIYRSSGSPVPGEILEGMDSMLELADLAYDDHKDGSVKQVLNEMGYNLIRHDTTTIPGYVGHYIALNSDPSKEKRAIISVKGSSNLEDFLTDMCASAVEYNLANPFYEGGSNTLRCHEGVFISSQRLAEELLPIIKNLLLPSGYKIVIVGHSLGAGCAAILSILLRSSIPSLQESDDILKVYAFASPPVLDLDSAIGCSSFLTTVVNNCDVVPRANVSPLMATMSLLRAVNKRLREQKLDMSDFQSTIAFLNKVREGKDGRMLMNADEFAIELDSALERADVRDIDDLYVPGKVVVMYDLWDMEQQSELDQQGKQVSIADILQDWSRLVQGANMHPKDGDLKHVSASKEAILCDGTCKVLRLIELDRRLLDDHMVPNYRSSINNLLSKNKNAFVNSEKV